MIEDDSNEPYKEVMKASLFKAYCDGVILKNYQFPSNDLSYIETKEVYRNFLLVCNELMNKRSSQLLNKQVNLFTTNIDLLVEDAMSNSGIEINDGFRGTITPVYNESNFQISISKSSLHFHKQSEVPMFNLIKVHGAVNWVAKRNYMGGEENIIESDIFQMYYIKEALSKIDEKYFIELSKKDAIGKPIDKTFDEVKTEAETVVKDLKDNVYKDFFDKYEKIVMINPTKEKFKTTVIDYHFYELMRIYSNALERENSILFVMGFSFADEHIAQITRRAADTNPTLQIIVFAYSDNDEDSYKKNLQIENGCSNNNILILTPSKFKASNENDYEDLCSKITNFDLKTINLVFKGVSNKIHSGYVAK